MTPATPISEENISSVYSTCEYAESDHPAPKIVVDGISAASKVFHAARLIKHRSKIIDLLHQLPQQSRQAGLPFRQLLADQDSKKWTNPRDSILELLVLGTAIGSVKFYLPHGKTIVSECLVGNTLDIIVVVRDKIKG